METGNNIIKAVSLIETLWTEIEALKGELERALMNVPSSAPIKFRGGMEEPEDESYYTAAHGWIFNGWRWTFPADLCSRRPGRKTRAGALSVAVDLGREGHPAHALQFPCLCVAWCPADDEWDDDLDADELWPMTSEYYELQENRLFWFIGKEEDGCDPDFNRSATPLQATWMYILPLFAISDRNTMDRLIVNPVLSLLGSSNTRGVFDEAEEILPFHQKDGEVEFIRSEAIA